MSVRFFFLTEKGEWRESIAKSTNFFTIRGMMEKETPCLDAFNKIYFKHSKYTLDQFAPKLTLLE